MSVHRCLVPLLVLGLHGWMPVIAAPADADVALDSRPLQVVRTVLANPEGIRQTITASLGGCAAKLNMPVPPIPPKLTDAMLGQFMVRRQEELFSGAHWALYDTERTIGADVRNGCQLTVFTRRRAESELQCRDHQGWGNAPLGELMDLEHPVDGSPTPQAASKHHGCTLIGRGIDPEGLPQDKAGSVACVWRSDVIGQKLEALSAKLGGNRPKAGHKPGSFDTCLYARTPEYRNAGGRRPVIVKTQAPTLVGQTGVTLHATEQNALELDRLGDDGDPIPQDRFSAASLKAFASQPTRTPLGD